VRSRRWLELNVHRTQPKLVDAGTENRNTEDEVLALKDWVEQNAASVLIVPSEIFSVAYADFSPGVLRDSCPCRGSIL